MTPTSDTGLDPWAALEHDDDDEQYPAPWMFFGSDADGSVVVGEFIRGPSEAQTRRGPAKVIVLRLKDDTERSIWLLWTSLRSQLKQARPKVGEFVRISHVGSKVGELSGNEYQDFRVKVLRESSDGDWDSLDDDDGDDFGSWG